MLKFLQLLFSVAIFFVATGCASGSSQHAERAVEEIIKRNGNCTTSACTLTMMRQLNDALPNSEPHKGPILNMMFKLYKLVQKVERGESNPRDFEAERIAIFAETQSELRRVDAMTAVQRNAQLQSQRQMLLEAQRLLSPTTSNVLTCRPAPGYSPGTTVCQ